MQCKVGMASENVLHCLLKPYYLSVGFLLLLKETEDGGLKLLNLSF